MGSVGAVEGAVGGGGVLMILHAAVGTVVARVSPNQACTHYAQIAVMCSVNRGKG